MKLKLGMIIAIKPEYGSSVIYSRLIVMELGDTYVQLKGITLAGSGTPYLFSYDIMNIPYNIINKDYVIDDQYLNERLLGGKA